MFSHKTIMNDEKDLTKNNLVKIFNELEKEIDDYTSSFDGNITADLNNFSEAIVDSSTNNFLTSDITTNLNGWTGNVTLLPNHSHSGNIGITHTDISSLWYNKFENPTRKEVKEEILESMIANLENEIKDINEELIELSKDDLGVYRINLEGVKRGLLITIKLLKERLS